MKAGEVVSTVLNLSVVVALAFFLLKPGGVARTAIENRRAEARERAQVQDAWPRLTETGARVDRGTGPVLLIEFSDYECVYCQQQHARLVEFLKANPDIGIVYRHFPLDMHPDCPRCGSRGDLR